MDLGLSTQAEEALEILKQRSDIFKEVKIQVDCKSLSHFVPREGIALVNTKGLHCCSEQVLQSRKCKKVRLPQRKSVPWSLQSCPSTAAHWPE